MSKLKIYRPVKSNYLTQKWGDSKACINNAGRVVTRMMNGLCPPRFRDFYKSIGLTKGHNGYDFGAYLREAVYVPVMYPAWYRFDKDNAGGLGVDIVSKEPLLKCTEPNCSKMHYIKVRLWHNDQVIGYERKNLSAGDLVALAGSTGRSSGVHVHMGAKWCDKNGVGIHKDNGSYGAFDYTPYYENTFIHDVLRREKISMEIHEKKETLRDLYKKLRLALEMQVLALKQKIHERKTRTLV